MDFQEAFLTLFWEPWIRMLASVVAVSVIVAAYWMTTRFTRFSTPSQTSHRFAGVGDSDDD